MKEGAERVEGRGCCIMCVGQKRRRCEKEEMQYGAILSHHKMASVGDGRGLSRVLGGCHMRTRVVRGGEIVARPSTILSCKIGAGVSREGLPLAVIERQPFGGWEWLSRAERE